MAILGLQGVRGGTGTTSITAALAWALQLLGETVLVVDASPDNMLRFFFNVDFSHKAGWARATIDGTDWRDAGLRYTSHIDLLPFGQLTPGERENIERLQPTLHQQALPVNSDILINDLRVGSQLQEDLYQLWLESQRRILPVTIHRDEAMAECLAAKQPLGEYRQDSLAAEEILTLANWCLLHYAGKGAE
ncbi:MAG: cellulose synthase operon protein YhjQ/BcsQ [Klebsiella grimontii]|nr:cellulose synthase operon protein YhjQ/BcsQ [Klebsiella grimontii]